MQLPEVVVCLAMRFFPLGARQRLGLVSRSFLTCAGHSSLWRSIDLEQVHHSAEPPSPFRMRARTHIHSHPLSAFFFFLRLQVIRSFGFADF